MVTDWLRDPRALMLVPLIAATMCALVLALTRKRMPPEEPRWRLVRALIVVAFWVAGVGVRHAVLGDRAAYLLLPPVSAEAHTWLSLAAHALGNGLFFGWLIPWGIEGRSLREMGWRRHKAVRYFLVAAVLTLLIAALHPMRGLPQDLQEALGIQSTSASAVFFMPGALVWVLSLGFIYSGWTEENLFRGHLLPAFREVGLSGRGANMAQAAVFIAIHIPGFIPELIRQRMDYGMAAMVATALAGCLVWWLWGLLFGWLRMRFDSIVPGFAVHGTWNSVRIARAWAGMFALMGQLGG